VHRVEDQRGSILLFAQLAPNIVHRFRYLKPLHSQHIGKVRATEEKE
jgi:hypothetical protein